MRTVVCAAAGGTTGATLGIVGGWLLPLWAVLVLIALVGLVGWAVTS